MRKKRILCGSMSKNGVSYHRLLLPYHALQKLYPDDYEVVFGYDNTKPIEEIIEYVKTFDFFVYNRLENSKLLEAIKGYVKIIIDIDDWWRLPDSHPSAHRYKEYGITQRIVENIKNADFVTTTTPILQSKIRSLGRNAAIFPNALIPQGQFSQTIKDNKRIRIATIGGSSHGKDMELLNGIATAMPKDLLDKVQFVLCGFDRSKMEDAEGNRFDIPWEYPENLWVSWERMFTDNYRTVSPEYKDFLTKYLQVPANPENEPYIRRWTEPIENYATLLDDIDIVLVPLVRNDFNACKSELKFVEAGVKGAAVIASNVAPYTICGRSALCKGGIIDSTGNCVFVDDAKGVKGWVKAIKLLVEDKELRNRIVTNNAAIVEERYNLLTVAEERKQWLDGISKG